MGWPFQVESLRSRGAKAKPADKRAKNRGRGNSDGKELTTMEGENAR